MALLIYPSHSASCLILNCHSSPCVFMTPPPQFPDFSFSEIHCCIFPLFDLFSFLMQQLLLLLISCIHNPFSTPQLNFLPSTSFFVVFPRPLPSLSSLNLSSFSEFLLRLSHYTRWLRTVPSSVHGSVTFWTAQLHLHFPLLPILTLHHLLSFHLYIQNFAPSLLSITTYNPSPTVLRSKLYSLISISHNFPP